MCQCMILEKIEYGDWSDQLCIQNRNGGNLHVRELKRVRENRTGKSLYIHCSLYDVYVIRPPIFCSQYSLLNRTVVMEPSSLATHFIQ